MTAHRNAERVDGEREDLLDREGQPACVEELLPTCVQEMCVNKTNMCDAPMDAPPMKRASFNADDLVAEEVVEAPSPEPQRDTSAGCSTNTRVTFLEGEGPATPTTPKKRGVSFREVGDGGEDLAPQMSTSTSTLDTMNSGSLRSPRPILRSRSPQPDAGSQGVPQKKKKRKKCRHRIPLHMCGECANSSTKSKEDNDSWDGSPGWDNAIQDVLNGRNEAWSPKASNGAGSKKGNKVGGRTAKDDASGCCIIS